MENSTNGIFSNDQVVVEPKPATEATEVNDAVKSQPEAKKGCGCGKREEGKRK